MNNKNWLQMIAGVFMVWSFFSNWIYAGGFTYFPPSEIMTRYSDSLFYKLFLVLPILGLANMYYGYLKQYNHKVSMASIAVSVLLMLNIISLDGKYHDYSVHTGFYMAMLAVAALVASIVVQKKELQAQQKEQ
ncbi:hypothetical protein ACFFJY_03195 [Fictibacillus aquaticus]|uniref:Uncharacterized protein n=1 Tax=Fictibacillus aquaticus TaxID=2021314 RepID=A0A235F9K7_9BACL|nr:hypothetical protein [Fictibacillus aquaticus]OYD57703.1 hypothetical protein CGZ90_13650 [Fictibacillus aquaticus]